MIHWRVYVTTVTLTTKKLSQCPQTFYACTWIIYSQLSTIPNINKPQEFYVIRTRFNLQ